MKRNSDIGYGISRRDVLKAGLAGGAALLLPGRTLRRVWGDESHKTDVWVFHGSDKAKLMAACMKTIDRNGGLGRDVKKLTLKVNAAWFRGPQQGANTNPELVAAFLQGCRRRGVRELVMPEHSCAPARLAFNQSGLLDAAKANGAKMIDLSANRRMFQDTKIPNAKRLRQVRVAEDFLHTDALVNLPVCKNHGATFLSAAMKNWMGAVEDRMFWHRNDLHQCIADFTSFIRPTWTIIDATRVLLDHGPQGPSRNLKVMDLLILSKDAVAADAFASTLWPGRGPQAVRYLGIADQMGLGTVDLDKMNVHKVEVS